MADFLLLRGWAREQRHWGEFPRHLRGEFRGHLEGPMKSRGQVHCLDHPGFGTEHKRLSPFSLEEIVEDLRYRWRQLNTKKPAFLIGISLGGMLAIQWAKQFPDDWQGLVMINSSLADHSRPWERINFRKLIQLKKTLSEKDAQVREEMILKMTTYLNAEQTQELARSWAQYADEFPVLKRNILAQLWAASRFKLGAPPVTPTLILASRKDQLVNPRCSEILSQKTGYPIEWHENAGHDLTLEDPAWATNQILIWTSTRSTNV